jgi:hypothetical protein
MLAFLIAAAVAAATPAQLPPVDRCQGDAGFDQFRAALDDAVARKDPAALRRLAADDVQSSFGGDGGWEEFASAWGLSQPQTSKLWTQLQSVMALGCAKTEAGGRVFPGMFQDLGDDADPFELVVVRPGAALRSAPDRNASAEASVDWAVTTVIEEPGPDDWVKVQVPGGPSGWVETNLIISPLDYRLVSELRDGRWRITALVAGD